MSRIKKLRNLEATNSEFILLNSNISRKKKKNIKKTIDRRLKRKGEIK